MKTFNNQKALFFLLILSFNSFALVDYSDSENTRGTKYNSKSSSSRKVIKRSSSRSNTIARSQPASSRSERGSFSLGTSFDTLSVDANQTQGEAKINKISFNMDYQTNYNIFLKAKFYLASSEKRFLVKDSTYQTGNTELILGFNWLRFGGEYDQGLLNFYGGASIGQRNSSFAHDRTDQIYGLETIKRFMTYAIGFGYELRISGKSKVGAGVGNIGKLFGSVGWEVSSDIRLSCDGATVSISPLGQGRAIYYSYFSPKIQLGLSPMTNLDLVALFNIKKANNLDAIAANLWDQKGILGNSLSLQFSFSI